MSKNLIVPIINSAVFTILSLVAIIGFQNDLANLFGISTVPKSGLSVLKDMVLPIFASFGGAISGAYIAFRLQAEKESSKTKEQNLSYVNRTIFTLHMQLTDLMVVKEQLIIPHKDNPLRFLMIPPLAANDQLSEKINMNFAQTLIDNDKPQLVQEILIAEKKYFNLMHILKERNILKIKIDTMLDENGFEHNTSFRLSKVQQIIGPQNIACIYDLTENFIKVLDNTVVFMDETINELAKASGEIFKGTTKSRVKFEKDDRYNNLLLQIDTPKFKSKNDLFDFIRADIADMKK